MKKLFKRIFVWFLKIYFLFTFKCIVSDYNFKFSQPSGTCVVELTLLLETAKACESSPSGNCFFFFKKTWFIVLFQAIARLPIFVGFILVTRFFFEVSAFFDVAVTPMLRRQSQGVSFQSGPVSLQIENFPLFLHNPCVVYYYYKEFFF